MCVTNKKNGEHGDGAHDGRGGHRVDESQRKKTLSKKRDKKPTQKSKRKTASPPASSAAVPADSPTVESKSSAGDNHRAGLQKSKNRVQSTGGHYQNGNKSAPASAAESLRDKDRPSQRRERQQSSDKEHRLRQSQHPSSNKQQTTKSTKSSTSVASPSSSSTDRDQYSRTSQSNRSNPKSSANKHQQNDRSQSTSKSKSVAVAPRHEKPKQQQQQQQQQQQRQQSRNRQSNRSSHTVSTNNQTSNSDRSHESSISPSALMNPKTDRTRTRNRNNNSSSSNKDTPRRSEVIVDSRENSISDISEQSNHISMQRRRRQEEENIRRMMQQQTNDQLRQQLKQQLQQEIQKQEGSNRTQERTRAAVVDRKHSHGTDYSMPLKGPMSDDENENEDEQQRRQTREELTAEEQFASMTNRSASSSSSSSSSPYSYVDSEDDGHDDDNPHTATTSTTMNSVSTLNSESTSPRRKSVTIHEDGSRRRALRSSTIAGSSSTISVDRTHASSGTLSSHRRSRRHLRSSADQVKILDIGFQKNKLRGRESEVQQLKAAIERSFLPDGLIEVVLVMGPSGTGKTRLVQEVLEEFQTTPTPSKPDQNNKNCFVLRGKFDPNHTRIYRPYAAFLEVFAQLSRQIQTHPDYKRFYQSNIRAILGKEAFRVTSLIPEFEEIVGDSGGGDGNTEWRDEQLKDQSSLFQVFRLLRGVLRQICTPENPVIIFLDDLNNGGSESLELFQFLFQDESTKNFLLIGTFEDEQHKPQGVDLLKASTIIRLDNLDADATNAFVSDVLGLDIHDSTIRKISEFFWKKTGGNCLFLTHYLYRLQQLEMMTYNYKTRSWAWTKKQKIQKERVDLAHVLKSRLQNLPRTAQIVLMYASMLGNTFPVNYLTIVLDGDPRINMKAICEQDIERNKYFLFENAIGMVKHEESGNGGTYKPANLTHDVHTIVKALTKLMILVPHPSFTTEYQFAHDKFHAATLDLVKDRTKVHWRIGKLLERTMEKHRGDGKSEANWLFYTVAEQLNMGSTHLETEADRIKLAELTYQCGKFMRDESAFYPSAAYAAEALKLLLKVKDRWEKHRELMTKLILLKAETVMCCGRTEDVMELTQEILENSRGWEDSVPAFFLRIRAFGQASQFAEAVHMGLAALMHLGEEFPHDADISTLRPDLEESIRRGFGKNEEDFENLTLMVDKKHQKIMEVLSRAVFYAIRGTTSTQKLVPFFFFRMYEITLEYGYCWDSIPAFAGYGILMAGAMNDYEEGYRFYKLAMMLQGGIGECYNARSSHMSYGFLHHLKEPLSDTLGPLMNGYLDGMSMNETADAVNCLSVWCSHYLNLGMSLFPLIDQMRDFLQIMKELKRERIWRATVPYVQLASNLAGQSNGSKPSELSGEFMDWTEMCDRLAVSSNINAIRAVHAAALEAAYWFGEYDKAGEMMEKLAGMDIGVGQSLTFNYRREAFFCGLVSVKLCRNSLTRTGTMYYMYKAGEFAAQVRLWFERGSPDCEDYALILEAEYKSVSSMFASYAKLAEGYLQAVEAARRIGSVQNIALSNELAGRYIADNVDHSEGIKLLKHARQAYRDWNAVAKAEHLEQMYTELVDDEEEEN